MRRVLSDRRPCVLDSTGVTILDEQPLSEKDHFQSLLCRLNPDRSDPIEIVRKLPSGAVSSQFGGGYLYFVLNEKHRSLWATMTDDDTAEGDSTLTLCRVPLDH